MSLIMSFCEASEQVNIEVRATVTPYCSSMRLRTSSTSTWSEMLPPQWQM